MSSDTTRGPGRRNRLPPARAVPSPSTDSDEVDAAVAMIEASFARIEAGDFDAAETVLAREGAALDVIFRGHAKDSAKGHSCFTNPCAWR